MSKKLAELLNQILLKPKGEPIEHLAFINNGEESDLRKSGGAGSMTKFGVRSFHGGGMTTKSSVDKPSNSVSKPSAMQGGFGAQAFGKSTASTQKISNSVKNGYSGGVSPNPTAMQGGFGAQAFGKSRTSTAAVKNAVAAGMFGGVKAAPEKPFATKPTFGPRAFDNSITTGSAVGAALARGLYGGVSDKKNGFTTASGWQVGPTGPVSTNGTNVTTVNKTLNLSPTKYPDRIPPEEQMRSQAYNANVVDMANQYARYRTSPNNVPAVAGLSQTASVSGTPKTQVADAVSYQNGYNPNGPETPANGIDANPAGDVAISNFANGTTQANPFGNMTTEQYQARLAQVDKKNSESIPVIAANLFRKTPVGGLLMGGVDLVTQNTGGIYGNQSGQGGKENFNFGSGNNSKITTDPSQIAAVNPISALPPPPSSNTQGPIGPAYSFATANGTYIIDSHGNYFMMGPDRSYHQVAPPGGLVA